MGGSSNKCFAPFEHMPSGPEGLPGQSGPLGQPEPPGKVPKSTQKTQKYPKIPKSSQKFPKTPKSSQKYQKLPKNLAGIA